MLTQTDLLEALPLAIYTTDAEGRITFYNEAAAQFWGHRPALASDQWCGSWRLYWPDGTPMPHDQCPMAVALKEGRAIRGTEAVAERPDGTRVPFVPCPTPLKDASGRVIGAINVLIETSERRQADIEAAKLASIVASSDDAIISKNLDGTVTSWNAAAARIFGYGPEEMIGQSILRIIPPELQHEEPEILAKLGRGERIDHFDTVRLAKDGRSVHVSLTVSPLRDRAGNVVGASKVARDVTERKRGEDLQRLLFDELNHRVKNTLATVQSIASQSLHRAGSPGDFVTSFNGRVQALARAHDLLVQGKMKGASISELVREQVLLGPEHDTRISAAGPLLILDSRAAVQMALVLHELATNARKYGALAVPTGRLSIGWRMLMQTGRELVLEWRESGVPDVSAPASHGFGTTLIERTVEAHGGHAAIRYNADGMTCEITLPLPDLDQSSFDIGARAARAENLSARAPHGSVDLRGKRILVVEDEPLVAMEIEAHLEAAGCQVVGPAGTIGKAKRLIAEARCDAALLDANLAGVRVDELAATLTQNGIPFAFATGYGREVLPDAFREAPLLIKPFSQPQLISAVAALLDQERRFKVVPLRA